VLVADADPQNTALHWAGMGGGFPAEVEDVSGEEGKLHKALRKRQEEFDYIVIDSPPAAAAPVTASALRAARLALVPVIPSPLDLWASVRIREAIAHARHKNPELEARLMVNQMQPNTLLARKCSACCRNSAFPCWPPASRAAPPTASARPWEPPSAPWAAAPRWPPWMVDALRREVERLLRGR
jgi:cellulose biosynthesis protein BcsQ